MNEAAVIAEVRVEALRSSLADVYEQTCLVQVALKLLLHELLALAEQVDGSSAQSLGASRRAKAELPSLARGRRPVTKTSVRTGEDDAGDPWRHTISPAGLS